MGIGNPAADRSVKQYLANVHARIRECPSSEPSKIYILARDQVVFKSLFFAVDRTADLLGLKVVDILRFPDNSGFLINRIWIKSLRSGDAIVFAFRMRENAVICFVKGLEMYFNICTLLKIELQPGYLFRSVTEEGRFSFKALEAQAAQARLNEYTNVEPVRGKLTSDRYTLHGF